MGVSTMNVSGIRPYQGFYNYNSKRVQQLQQELLAVEQEAGSKEKLPEEKTELAAQGVETSKKAAPRQNYTSADYAKEYDPGAVYDKKDKEVSLSMLDVEKAVSDLDKDQVLRRYQYFVDSAKEPGPVVSPMAFRRQENFDLI